MAGPQPIPVLDCSEPVSGSAQPRTACLEPLAFIRFQAHSFCLDLRLLRPGMARDLDESHQSLSSRPDHGLQASSLAHLSYYVNDRCNVGFVSEMLWWACCLYKMDTVASKVPQGSWLGRVQAQTWHGP